MPPLRVGFDARDLLRKRTGVVNYAVHLVREVGARGDVELVAYVDGFRDPCITPPEEVPLRYLAAPPVVWKHLALPAAVLRDRVSVLHSPTGTLPLWAPARQVVTVHDLFAEIEPRWFPAPMAAHLRRAQRRAVGAATQVIAVSERTRQDVLERYRVSPRRVRVVHNGVDHRRFRPLHEIDAGNVAERFGVRHPFVLCVGSLLPWRNAPRLLEAVALVRERFHIPCGLLFVGRDIWGTDPTARIARERGWDGWAKIAGYVRDEELPALYRSATLFAYPSLYEGFGIPPLEAMACGTPVVASTAGAIPEVLGDAALLVHPADVEALAEALRRGLEDSNLRATLSARGQVRAARYTWGRAASETVEVYRQAAT